MILGIKFRIEWRNEASLGGEGWKPLTVGLVFLTIHWQGKTRAKHHLKHFLLGFTITIMTPLSRTYARPANVAKFWPWPLALHQVLQNSGSSCSNSSCSNSWRVKTRSVQDRHRQNNIKEREYTECSNIKESVHLRAQCQSGVLGLLRLNIKARHEIPDFLNANLWSIRIPLHRRIGHRLELKYFHYAQFLLNAHRAAHWPRKSENWELET